MKTPIILFALVAAVGSNCSSCPPPHVPDPKPWDAGTATPDPELPPGTDPAEAACKKLEELKCMSKDGRPLWEPTPGGVSCPDVFRNAEKNGVNLHPACIASMKACEERDACTDKN